MKHIYNFMHKEQNGNGFSDTMRAMLWLYHTFDPETHRIHLLISQNVTISRIFKTAEATNQDYTSNDFRFQHDAHRMKRAIEMSEGDYYGPILCYDLADHCFSDANSLQNQLCRRLYEYHEPYESEVESRCLALVGEEPFRVVICRCGDYVFGGATIEKDVRRRIVRAMLAEKTDGKSVFICDVPEIAEEVLARRDDFLQYTFAPCYLPTYTGPEDGCLPILTALRLITKAKKVHSYHRWSWGSSGFGWWPARVFQVPFQFFTLRIS